MSTKTNNMNTKTTNEQKKKKNTHCAGSVKDLQQALPTIDGHLLPVGVIDAEAVHVRVGDEAVGEGGPTALGSQHDDLELFHWVEWVVVAKRKE